MDSGGNQSGCKLGGLRSARLLRLSLETHSPKPFSTTSAQTVLESREHSTSRQKISVESLIQTSHKLLICGRQNCIAVSTVGHAIGGFFATQCKSVDRLDDGIATQVTSFSESIKLYGLIQTVKLRHVNVISGEINTVKSSLKTPTNPHPVENPNTSWNFAPQHRSKTPLKG